MSKQTATEAFIARKAQIDALINRLQSLSEDHFRYTPDDINWGHVGMLGRCAELLRRTVASVDQNDHH